MPEVKSTIRRLIILKDENGAEVDATFTIHANEAGTAAAYAVVLNGATYAPAAGSETVLTRQAVGRWIFKRRLETVGEYLYTVVGDEPVADVAEFSVKATKTRVAV